MYCKHCGTPLNATAKFCTSCGRPIESVPSLQPNSETRRKMPLWFKSLLFIVALLIGALFLGVLLTEDLTDTVEQQLEAIRQGRLTEAYYAFTSPQFQEKTSLEAFTTFIKQHPAFSQNVSIHFRDRNVNDDIGVLNGVITTSNDKTIQVEYKLIREADKWKILSIRIEDIGNATSTIKHDTATKATSALSSESNVAFNKFVLGNAISPIGIVSNASTHFNTDAGDLYLNLYVTGSDADTKITIVFEHLDSQSTLNPVTIPVAKKADAMLSFVFSPPHDGWPIGQYRIQALSTTGTQSTFDFQINHSGSS